MEKKFDFFNDHSEQYLEMALCSDYFEILAAPDGYGKNTGDCKDTIEVFLCADNGQISDISFRIEGCINTRACANTIGRMVKGEKISRAWTILPEDITNYLQTLPQESHHCAELACGALYRALADLQTNIRDPWKKNYIFR
ncbi:MAG: iron-sulfur cluster assembly scaffold protein [Desulfobacteraceae bacterium]|nr:iron-sulfur cluster assembly scaffold protein [Desulfobacteraceae bacterium]